MMTDEQKARIQEIARSLYHQECASLGIPTWEREPNWKGLAARVALRAAEEISAQMVEAERERITAELQEVCDHIRRLYEKDDIPRWLLTRHPTLDNESPLQTIVAGRTSDILDLIDQLESGAYV